MTHTPEPWVQDENRFGTPIVTGRKTDGFGEDLICILSSRHERNHIDAARIVACVNACAGFTNEELETLGHFKAMHETIVAENELLRAKIERKFVWVGWNKHFKKYWVSDPLTTRQLLERKYPSFFNIENDNCIFVMEIFEGDTLIYYSRNSMSSMTVKIENGVFVGEGPFNTHPLEVYFNSGDFVNMERDVSSCI